MSTQKSETPNTPNAGGNKMENAVHPQNSTDGGGSQGAETGEAHTGHTCGGSQPTPKQVAIRKMRRAALMFELEAARLRADADYQAAMSVAYRTYLKGLADAQRG